MIQNGNFDHQADPIDPMPIAPRVEIYNTLMHLFAGAVLTALAGGIAFVALRSLALPYVWMAEASAALLMLVWIGLNWGFHATWVRFCADRIVRSRARDAGIKHAVADAMRARERSAWGPIRRVIHGLSRIDYAAIGMGFLLVLRSVGFGALIFVIGTLASLVIYNGEITARGALEAQQHDQTLIQSAVASVNKRQGLIASEISVIEGRINQLREEADPAARRSALREQLSRAESERVEATRAASDARTLEICERNGGNVPGCSGDAGCEVRCREAIAMAEHHESQVRIFDDQIEDLHAQLDAVPSSVEARSSRVAALKTLEDNLAEKRGDLAAFIEKRPEAIEAAVKSDPRSSTIETRSIYEQLRILGELMADLPAFARLVLALKVGLIAIDFASLMLTVGLGPSRRDVWDAYSREIMRLRLDTKLVHAADTASRAQWTSYTDSFNSTRARASLHAMRSRARAAGEPSAFPGTAFSPEDPTHINGGEDDR